MIPGTEGLSPRAAIRLLVNLHAVSNAIRTMAVLGFADHLVDGPRTVQELAEEPAPMPQPSLASSAPWPQSGCAPTTRRAGFSSRPWVTSCARMRQGRCARTPWRLPLLTPCVPGTSCPRPLTWVIPLFPDVHDLGFWDYLSAYPEEGTRFDGAMSGAVVTRAEALIAARDLSSIGNCSSMLAAVTDEC